MTRMQMLGFLCLSSAQSPSESLFIIPTRPMVVECGKKSGLDLPACCGRRKRKRSGCAMMPATHTGILAAS